MGLFIPTIYKKNVFEIPYLKLKEEGIHCLVFDLDNTLGLVSNKYCPEETKKLIEDLKKDFLVVISSNNNKKRIQLYLDELKVDGFAWSLKPTTKGLSLIKKKYNLKKEEMCMIGDQMVTDIVSGNKAGITTILLNPISKKDRLCEKFDRMKEKKIMKKLRNNNLFVKGRYYE